MKQFTSGAAVLRAAFLFGAAFASMPVFAQAPAVTTFSIERVVQLSNISTVATPTIPVATLGALTSGALEVRERLIYNPALSTLTSTIFTVTAGAPIPTSLAIDVTQQTLAQYAITVDRVYVGTKPAPSIMFVGSVQSSAATPFGTLGGAPAAVSVGYTTDTPAKINTVVEDIAGVGAIYSAAGSGSVIVTQPPVTPGGGGGTTGNPVVVVAQTNITTTVKQIRLDASGTTDPNGTALTYLWTSGVPSATIINKTSPTPDVQFDSGFGTYVFTVTVTNAAGLVSTGTVTVLYQGR